LYYRKKEREKGSSTTVQDISKLGFLGALTGLALEEEKEMLEGEAVEEEDTKDQTETEEIRQNSIDIRLQTEQNALIRRMEQSTKVDWDPWRVL
jgi:hypothetical protein